MATGSTDQTTAEPGPADRPGSGRLTLPRRRLLAGAGRGALVAAAAGPLAALSGCGEGAEGGGQGQALKIGLLAPLTGPVAPEGVAMQRGLDLAVAEINAGDGVLGQPIEVVTEDDQGTPSVATTAARKLLERDQVHLVFGTIAGDTTVAVKGLSQQARVPFMKAILDDYLHSELCSDYFFKLGESDYQLLQPLLPFMVEQHGPRVALVGNDYSFPHAYNETAKPLLAEAGAEVVAEEYAPLGTTEWSSVIAKLTNANPDFVLSSVVGGDAVALLQQADSLGLLRAAQITGVSVNQEFYPGAGGLLDGRYVTVRYSDQLDNDANQQFVSDYRDRYDDDAPIPSVTANSYVGVHLLAQAVESAGSTEADAIVEALRGVRQTGSVYGPDEISFDAKNQVLSTNIYLTQVKPGGRYTVVEEAGVTADPTRC